MKYMDENESENDIEKQILYYDSRIFITEIENFESKLKESKMIYFMKNRIKCVRFSI